MLKIIIGMLLAPFHAGLCYFGGGSSSSAATTNETQVRDMRVVGGDGSTNLSANDSAINVTNTTTDLGAIAAGTSVARAGLQVAGDASTAVINGGFALASKAVDSNTKTTSDALKSAGDMFAGALSGVSDATKGLQQAYQNGQAPDQTMLKYAGFIVVGLAAVALLAKRA